MKKINTLLMYQNSYESSSWSSFVFYSRQGFDSIQEFVEAIAPVFKDEVKEESKYWTNKTINEENTCDHITDIFRETFQSTTQEFWEKLVGKGIETTCLCGNLGESVMIGSGPELITETIFNGFPKDDNWYGPVEKDKEVLFNKE